MRIIALISVLTLTACSVSDITDRHSGPGISNSGVPSASGSTTPAGDEDYRGKLMEELGGA